jgi:dehydrogenase/reductase SDR family member 7B
LEFKGKTAWITGASSGIGEALAFELARLGSHLILSSRNKEKLDFLAKEITAKFLVDCEVVPVDLEENSSILQAVEKVKNLNRKIDILINNAGMSQRSLILETPVEIERKVFELNYFGTITLTKLILPVMIDWGGGLIVVMSSVVGKFGFPLRSAYSASKHALHGFFETLRSELYDKNIRVSIICPGRIATNVSLNAITKDGTSYGKMDDGQAKGLPADKFAKRVVRTMKKERKESIMGGKEVILVYIRRFFPWIYYILARKVKPT